MYLPPYQEDQQETTGSRQLAPVDASKLMLPGNTLVHLLEGADAVSWLSRLRRHEPHDFIGTLRPQSVRLDELYHLPRPELRISHVRAVASRRGERPANEDYWKAMMKATLRRAPAAGQECRAC